MTDEEIDRLAERVAAKLAAISGRRYLSLGEAGDYCAGRSAEAMRMMARRGRFKIIKMGNSTVVDRLDLDRAMQEMKSPE